MKLYVNPCRCCIFVGHDESHDFYYCTLGTVVARFGNEPWAFHTGAEVAASLLGNGDSAHPLATALGLARRYGFMR